MRKDRRAQLAVEGLRKRYPDAVCSLDYQKPYELLIATRLSAQCTDHRVNLVTRELFVRFPTLQAFADADLHDLEEAVKPCGLYKTKAKSIKEMANTLLEKHGGQLPDTMEELTALSGIGRKTANLILGDIFHQPAVVVDTHCIRITNRLGLVDTNDPYRAEMALKALLPPEESNDFCHRLVHFGREICKARNPLCEECPLNDCCADYQQKNSRKRSVSNGKLKKSR